MSIRTVGRTDVRPLSAALLHAFDDDPILNWTYPGDRSRRFWGRRFFAWQSARLRGQDVSWTTSDCAGAALWALPQRWSESPGDVARAAWASGFGLIPRAPRVLRGLATVERKHASMAPHMYLAVLGVEPERQGLGLGSQLLRPGLELCDAEGLPAYLETGKERNLAFYGRHGFDVIDQIVLPGGPPLWFMWREAR